MMPDFIAESLATEEELDTAYAAAVEALEALELRNMLRGEEDRMGAIVDINAGAGGTEALDWADMLLRMYTRWCEAHGYKVIVEQARLYIHTIGGFEKFAMWGLIRPLAQE